MGISHGMSVKFVLWMFHELKQETGKFWPCLLLVALLITFRCVCDVTIAPRIASTANTFRWRNCGLTRFTTTVVIIWEILGWFFLKLRQIILFIFKIPAFRHWFSKYRPFTGLCSINSKIPTGPVKYRPTGNPSQIWQLY